MNRYHDVEVDRKPAIMEALFRAGFTMAALTLKSRGWARDDVKAEAEEVRALAERVLATDLAPHTKKNRLGKLRKIVNAVLADHGAPDLTDVAFHYVLRVDDQTADAMDAYEAERLERKATGGVTAFPKWREFLGDVIDARFESKQMSALYLLAVTGRRPVEIQGCNFEWRFENDNTLRFSGQAKKRETDTRGSFVIPVLHNGQEVIKMLARHKDRTWQNTLSNRYALREAWDKANLPWPEGVPMDARHLRALYACATYELNAPNGWQSWRWAAEVLGHEPRDTTTPQTYLRFKLD